jgi:hypothetical protein
MTPLQASSPPPGIRIVPHTTTGQNEYEPENMSSGAAGTYRIQVIVTYLKWVTDGL